MTDYLHNEPPDYTAELERIAAQLRDQHPHLETWMLAYLSGKDAGFAYSYETHYKPVDRPYRQRGTREK